MDNDKVLLDIKNYIATLTLNRPERLNALDRDVWEGLKKSISEIQSNGEVRVLVIKGAGDKAFSSGLDLSPDNELLRDFFTWKDRKWNQSLEGIIYYQDIFNAIELLAVPVIASMNGKAIGGGIEIALTCDIRLCSDDATFRLSMNTLGFIADQGGIARLSRLVGPSRAKKLFFTGWEIDAREALRIGLVDEVYGKKALEEKTYEMAEAIASSGPLPVQATKRAINMGLNMALKDALTLDAMESTAILYSDDFLEGIRAFQEKRKPDFKGK